MCVKNNQQGFTLIELLFAASLLAVLTAVGMFAMARQSKVDLFQKDLSEMDHAAYSILGIISREIRSAGHGGPGSIPIIFVDGGEINSDGKCDPASEGKNLTDCITLESVEYKDESEIQKSFFVEEQILKMKDAGKNKQSLTPSEAGVKVEDFQITFLIEGEGNFQDTMEPGKIVEAVRISLTLRSRGSHQNATDRHILKTYQAVANPRNI